MGKRVKNNLINNKEKERRKKAMYRKEFSIFALLLIAMLVLAGCGSSGNSTTSTSSEGKTAKVNLSFAFPEEGEVGSAVLSETMTHILVHVKQWTTDDLSNLRVVNTDKALLTKASPSTTIDLFPTYTRICASQWKGDPNDSATSNLLETACTFGKLIPGSNTVNLTMLRGTWTLASPLTTSLGNVSSVALGRGAKSGSYYEGYDLGSDVFDGNVKDPFDMPTQAFNNFGSIYQAMFKVGDAYKFLSYGGAWYTNFFGSDEPNLLIGGGEEIVPEPTTGPSVNGVVIGGFGKPTEANNVYRQEKQVIQYMGYRTTESQSGCNYEGYWNEQSWYECYNPVLVTAATELTIFDKNGIKVTKDYVDQCQLQITGGNTIKACAGTETSASGTEGTETDYTHKVTSKFITKGANLCFSDDMLADKDSSGNIICYHYDYSYWWDGSKYVYNCYDGGTYNTATGRCEMNLQTACYGSYQDPLHESYDSTTQTCTWTETGYLNVVTFNPTPVTLTGVGSLPSSMVLTTAKKAKNPIKW